MRTKISETCHYCGDTFFREAAYIKVCKQRGDNVYCNRTCAGLGRRTHKNKEQKLEDKRLYDITYREKNLARDRPRKAAYYQKVKDPEKERLFRIKQKKERPEIEAGRRKYMASPEYRKHKKEYDQVFRAKKKYGEFWESAVIAIEINTEVKSRSSAIEIRKQNGTLNKYQTRKRQYDKTNSTGLEGHSLGNA